MYCPTLGEHNYFECRRFEKLQTSKPECPTIADYHFLIAILKRDVLKLLGAWIVKVYS